MISLMVGCKGSDVKEASIIHRIPPATDSPIPLSNPDSVPNDPVSVCPESNGVGTIPPAISIHSITFLVNGLEQIVFTGDRLQASAGDQVQVTAATICAGTYSGNGGEACVDLTPIDRSGQEITPEHKGSHMVRAPAGLITISNIELSWIVDENWNGFAAVVNHWPTEKTQDLACAAGRCERDDRIIIEFGQ